MRSKYSLLIALKGLRSNKLRSCLTIFGIIIGIASVIVIDALGQGGTASVIKEFEKIGSNLIVIQVAWDKRNPRMANDLTTADVEVIKKLIPEVQKATATSIAIATIKSDKDQKSIQLIGTTHEFGELRNLKLKAGRFLNFEDLQGQRRVIILEDKTVEDLFSNDTILGKNIYINNVPTIVIGIVKTEDPHFNGSNQKLRTAYVPLDFIKSVSDVRMLNSIEVKTTNSSAVDNTLSKTIKILERRHDKQDGFYRGVSLEKEMDAAKKTVGIITMVIEIIASISLIVGGIGVMNIMLVAVTERTREIGIKKALGAKRKDILFQFIYEAILICFTGGLIGILIGMGTAFIIAQIAKLPLLLSWWSIFLSLFFSIAIGLFFGIYPANKAAHLEPIEALRYE